MIKYFILLILIIPFIIVNGQITNNDITLNSISLSSNNISITSTFTQSITFIFSLSVSNSISITEGFLVFPGNIPTDIQWDQTNQISGDVPLSGTFEIQVCVPMNTISGCGINSGVQSITCEYSIRINHSDQKSYSSFLYNQITKSFQNAFMSVYQNTKAPVVSEFQVTVHPKGPLVSFQLSVEYFGIGLGEIQINYSNDKHQPFFLIQTNFNSNNGYYYLESILQPEVTGYLYRITSIFVLDTEDNSITLLPGEFGVSSFQLPMSDEPILPNLFSFTTDKNNPYVAQGNQYTFFKAYMNLVSPYLPVICMPSILSICAVHYINSTNVEISAQVLPNFIGNMGINIDFISLNSYSITVGKIEATYYNGRQFPEIISSSFSIPEINQLEPFFVEVNFTVTLTDAILSQVYFSAPNQVIFMANNIQSGNQNLTACIVGGSFLFDSSQSTLSTVELSIVDTKAELMYYPFFQGPVTTMRKVISDMTFTIDYQNTVFDLSNATFAQIPITITTSTNHSDNIVQSSFVMVGSNIPLISGMTNYSSIQSQIVKSNGIETVYQTYALIQSALASWQTTGDFLLTVTSESPYIISSKTISKVCFTIQRPQFQPTIITSFEMLPSNIVYSNQTSNITLSIQTKGYPVNQLQLIQYLDEVQNQNLNNILSTCVVLGYDFSTLITDIQCTIPVANIPSQTILFYIDAIIQGQPIIIPNVQLQESGLSSYIEIIGPLDNGLVPNVTQFSTTFNSTSNTISIQYNIENECNFVAPDTPVEFTIFSKLIATTAYGTETQISITQNSFSGSFDINLCELDGFDFSYSVIGIYISIPSTIAGTQYQFPYEYLAEMDPNQQNFPTNNAVCDFSGPRLVDTGIVYPLSIYDTSNQSINITIYFDITDDLSGFSILYGYIRLIGLDNGVNGFYNQELIIGSGDIGSGNLRNGRYYFNFKLPQYTNGTYQFGVTKIFDIIGNMREYTYQNIQLISSEPPQVNVYSDYPDPNLPSLVNVVVNGTSFNITTKGGVSSVYLLPSGPGLPTLVYAQQLSVFQYVITLNENQVNSGTYNFGVCINTLSLTSICYSSLDLEAMSIPNSFEIFNNGYFN
ncbi:EGF-like domain-containing protein [Tieghemostelium lacteum]|uniref:EGF-like domain-containing protein n=1 Tax=Tieghemostelium lacteum TaxID=361077 RepID=A0A151Z7F8_TIELA|nr:EGF-like domain-containing protein [Tieghemostelium lacteum]|eukprot:KYQ89868.1 EGF-like domain-containing protein [Tieghemostelium lacteum]